MIRVAGLEKAFGPLQVLRRTDLEVSPGEVVALAGPNASGKTTLLRCILGLVRADAGLIEVCGSPVDAKGAYRSRIGYMPQTASFPRNLTGEDLIAFVGGLRHGPRRADVAILESFHLLGQMQKPLRVLSGGTRQKISAVLAFLFNPDVLILDEPTAGLDPVSSSVLRDQILAARAAGKTILLTSHTMSEVEEVADRMVFLLEGRINFNGAVSALREQTGEQSLERALAVLMRGSES